MPVTTTIAPDGTRIVTMSEAEYQDLVDARDSATIAREVASGRMDTVSSAELDECLARPLTFWRKRRGLTQNQLANAVGIKQATLSQLESGTRVGTVRVLLKLAATLSITVEDIVSGVAEQVDASRQKLVELD